jgi:phosphohistidine phosphatase
MKTLYLLRHAKASKDDPTPPDFKRPLTDRGFADARLVSETLRGHELVPEKIISSSALRARTTAFVFAAAFEKPDQEITLKDELYEALERDYMEVIAGIGEEFSSCMIAGHNDTISSLAARFLRQPVEPMRTCGVMIISSDADNWKEFESGKCSLVLNLYPALLKE